MRVNSVVRSVRSMEHNMRQTPQSMRLGALGMTTYAALHANRAWGEYLDRPQTVSGSDVDRYIGEARRKGIYNKPKKRSME